MGKSIKERLASCLAFVASFYLKFLCNFCTQMFFREVVVINKNNIPSEGPTIVFGNHNNQFVDGMLLYAIVKRNINFIAAAISMRRPFLGQLIQASGAIPVERAQDVAKKGPGVIVSIQGDRVKGKGTKFTQLTNETLQVSKQTIKIKEVISDTELITVKQQKQFKLDSSEQQYKITPKLQFDDLYEKVWKALAEGKCVGIFPEGGSHDKTELMPLKGGICIMALGEMKKYGKPVSLVPAGFNYYNPHKFRSKAIIEFGPPLVVPQEVVDLYKEDHHKAISLLLKLIEDMLKDVTTECRSFEELSTLFLCRELYTLHVDKQLTVKQKLELNRRFSKAYDQLIGQPELKALYEKLKRFNQFCKIYNLNVNEQHKHTPVFLQVIKFIIYAGKCLFRALLAIPAIVLLGPTVLLILYQTEQERKRQEKKMNYEEQAKDVVGSYKILLSLIYFPITAIVHMVILYYSLKNFTRIPPSLCFKMCWLIPILMPFYFILLAKAYDSLGKNFKKLRILFSRFFQQSVYSEFNQTKKELSEQIRQCVDRYGEKVYENFEGKRILKKEEVRDNGESKDGKKKKNV